MIASSMRRLAVLVLLLAAAGSPLAAQDLEPRAYSASPIGTTFVVASVGRSTGNVLLDPSLPIEDVNARIGVLTAGVGQTFDLLTRTALIVVGVPYGRARASGRIQENAAEVTRVGLADARVKLSVNLFGDRARRLPEFAKAPRSTIVGASLTVGLPTGEYFRDRLVNLGSHRWAVKPEAGVSVPLGRWNVDAYAGVWFFGANDEFYPGSSRRTQSPVLATQGHASYTFRPRMWAAVDATWYTGGRTTIDGVANNDLQRNSRLGATMSVPIGPRQSLKAAVSKGATIRVGGDFTTVAVVWQMTFIRR